MPDPADKDRNATLPQKKRRQSWLSFSLRSLMILAKILLPGTKR